MTKDLSDLLMQVKNKYGIADEDYNYVVEAINTTIAEAVQGGAAQGGEGAPMMGGAPENAGY